MIKRIIDRLVSRRVSVALMAFVVGAAGIGVLVPQRSNNTLAAFEAWQRSNPTYSQVVSALQFDRVFSSGWFLVGLVLFGVSLFIATVRLLGFAWRMYARGPESQMQHVPGESLVSVSARARAAGYREAPSRAGVTRFVRHRFGWWASALMHLGMVITLVSGAASSAFDAHGVIDLSQGEIHSPGDELLYEESGLLGVAPELESPMRLDGVEAALWPTGEVRFLTTRISVMDQDGSWVQRQASANEPLAVGSYMIYVSPTEFGDAAFVELSGAGLPAAAVRLEFPETPEGAVTYADIQPEGWPLVEGRMDPSGQREDSDGKLLALRIKGDEGTYQSSLDPGETVELGPYTARFAASADWARLVVVRPVAIELIFFGFAIICLGSFMIYAWVPRELALGEGEDGGVSYSWRAARVPRMYRSELDTILGKGEVEG